MSIRPVIIVQTNPQTIEKGQPLIISARFYDRDTNIKQTVSKIYLNIISLKDGNTIWPVEVVRKNDWKMDIEVGSENMKVGHEYLVRVSNNRNLSPQGASEFKVKKTGGKGIILSPVALPVSQSLVSITSQAIKEKFTPSEIEKELRRMYPDLNSDEIKKLKDAVLDNISGINPTDDVTKRLIEKKKFVTQMDSRVCPICQEASEGSSPGEAPGMYLPDDIDAPKIPLHFNCRCTYDIVFNETFEATFHEVLDVIKVAQAVREEIQTQEMLKVVQIIDSIS